MSAHRDPAFSPAVAAEPCNLCCHDTRNAMAAVIYYAKQVQRHHPGLAPALLNASLTRLDQAMARCADGKGD